MRITRDDRFYWELVTFQVDNILYKVPKQQFAAGSSFFRNLFEFSRSDGVIEGRDDKHPIHLPGATKDEFRILLKAVCSSTVSEDFQDFIKDDWVCCLRLATMWDLERLRKLSVERLDKGHLFASDVEKVGLGMKYQVPVWVDDGISALVKRKKLVFTQAEKELLGLEAVVQILEMREESQVDASLKSSKVLPVLLTKSAWSRGPPANTASSSSSSRSQSPAPSNAPTPVSATSTHSRRPSTLGGQAVPIKDGVSIPRNTVGSVRQASSPVTFGSPDDISVPVSSSPAATPTPSVKGDGVKSFGSIAAAAAHSHSPSVQLNGKPPGAAHASKPSVSNPIATSTTTTTTPAPASKAAPATKPMFDVKSLFRSAGKPGAAGSPPAPTTTS